MQKLTMHIYLELKKTSSLGTPSSHQVILYKITKTESVGKL